MPEVSFSLMFTPILGISVKHYMESRPNVFREEASHHRRGPPRAILVDPHDPTALAGLACYGRVDPTGGRFIRPLANGVRQY